MNNNDLNGINLGSINQEPISNPVDSNMNLQNNQVTDANVGMNVGVASPGMNNVGEFGMQSSMSTNEPISNNNYNASPSVAYDASASVQNMASQPKKCKGLLIGLIIAVLAIAGGVVGFFLYRSKIMSDPVVLTANIIKEVAKEATEEINNYNANLEKLKNTKLYDSQIHVEFEDFVVDVDSKLNLKDMIMSLGVDASVYNENILNVNGVLTKENVYFSLLKDSSNIYGLDFSDNEVILQVEGIDLGDLNLDPILSNFIKYFGESFEEKIDKSAFKESSESITVDGKNVNANKYVLGVSSNTLAPIIDAYRNKLLGDEALLKAVVDLYNKNVKNINGGYGEEITVSDLKDMIKESVKIDESELNNEVKFNYALYVKGNDLLKVELFDEEFKIVLELFDGIRIKAIENDEIVGDIHSNDEKLVFNIKNSSQEVVEGHYSYKDGKYKITYESYGDVINLEGVYKDNSTDKETNIEATVAIKAEGETYSGKLKFVSKNPDSLNIDIPSNYLDISDEANMTILYDELMQIPVLSELLTSDMPQIPEIDYNYEF